MKQSFLKISIFTLLLVTMFTSCEKDNEVSFEEQNQESNVEAIVTKTPLLHMKFDKNVSKQEAKQQWDAAVKDYISKNSNPNKGISSEVWFQFITETGTQTHNGTNGRIEASVKFKHDKGKTTTAFVHLDDAGGQGQTDYYLFGISYPNIPALSWVEARRARLRLRGTDGWLVTGFEVKFLSQDQTTSANGSSTITSTPNTWLDNNNANRWDTFNTGNIGTGKLNF